MSLLTDIWQREKYILMKMLTVNYSIAAIGSNICVRIAHLGF